MADERKASDLKESDIKEIVAGITKDWDKTPAVDHDFDHTTPDAYLDQMKQHPYVPPVPAVRMPARSTVAPAGAPPSTPPTGTVGGGGGYSMPPMQGLPSQEPEPDPVPWLNTAPLNYDDLRDNKKKVPGQYPLTVSDKNEKKAAHLQGFTTGLLAGQNIGPHNNADTAYRPAVENASMQYPGHATVSPNPGVLERNIDRTIPNPDPDPHKLGGPIVDAPSAPATNVTKQMLMQAALQALANRKAPKTQ